MLPLEPEEAIAGSGQLAHGDRSDRTVYGNLIIFLEGLTASSVIVRNTGDRIHIAQPFEVFCTFFTSSPFIPNCSALPFADEDCNFEPWNSPGNHRESSRESPGSGQPPAWYPYRICRPAWWSIPQILQTLLIQLMVLLESAYLAKFACAPLLYSFSRVCLPTLPSAVSLLFF